MAFQSPAPQSRVNPQEIPLKMIGGNNFGRYLKSSDEQTWNMIVTNAGEVISLVDYAGYQNVFDTPLVLNSRGRGIYQSVNGNIMIAVIGSEAYSITIGGGGNLLASPVGTLTTSSGDVYISENNNSEIGITDGVNLYIYTYSGAPTFVVQALPFTNPGYISFHLGRLIIAQNFSQNWWLSGINDATQWSLTDPTNKAYVGTISLKPDHIQAVVPLPGQGNNLAVFGHTVVELWQYNGNALFLYQRASNFNIDYGCLNPSSIAALDSYIVWLSSNEQGGATVMIFDGGRENSISTDGIDFKLANLTNPTNCTGFLFRQDGHLIYQFTFPDDNLSYIYDFNTKLFFTVSDENQNYHIARNVVYFNNNYYFVSLNDGNIYNFGTQFSSLQYSATNIKMMPRIRITPPFRLPSQRMFIIKSIGFTVENGQPNEPIYSTRGYNLITQDGLRISTQDGKDLVTQPAYLPLDGLRTEAIDLSISRDGAASFGTSVRRQMNATGKRRSRFIFQRLGQANDATVQIKFIGYGRFLVVDNGMAELYT